MLKLLSNILVYREGRWKSSEILIADRRIARIAEAIVCRYDAMERIDGGGCRAVPGYIDQHVHITGGGGEGGFSTQVPPLAAGALMQAGTTTVVGLLGTDGTTRSVESVVAKAKALKEEGLSAYCLTGAYQYPSPTVTGSVRKDIMMIDEVIGVKIAIADHRSSGITKEELVRLAADARQAGILSGKAGIVHLHTGKGDDGLALLFRIIRESNIPVGTFRPTHLGNKLEEALRFASLGGYIDFTTGEEHEGTARVVAEALHRAPKGLVTMSSDGNGSIPVWDDRHEMIGLGVGKVGNLHGVVEALVKNENIPLEEAVLPCTENVAKALLLYPRKGCLQEGSDADILLLNEEMRQDSLIAGGKVVMRHGRLVRSL
ncbi:beta-aspartyl-peptidase [Sediminispirochaeta smaragdinae]|uniref:Isoaspartyl dipeptidase n=1 Tax=Sediminispirochaeta smaragdinae (strain DSM 11293 / JCM 15392 / SEBR 4228) TaxID=573413 RepID=E1R4N2_SEDSS|nr:beta-aspartyl-peptidase [Sediminispirochaeta smaragdinae]ADK82120.1 isoaspartyl dipeptidase [Sediminispirochaeta smaragdinae DSM 11293]